jgi:hypothetical protein
MIKCLSIVYVALWVRVQGGTGQYSVGSSAMFIGRDRPGGKRAYGILNLLGITVGPQGALSIEAI